MNIQEIEDEIIKIEHSETSWQNCERLSWLYIVYDHLKKSDPVLQDRSMVVPNVCGSEFLDACRGINITELLYIIDEHLEAVRSVFPKEYLAVMSQIKKTSQL